jgi:hypothetical protein
MGDMMSRRMISVGLFSIATAVLVAVTPSAAVAAQPSVTNGTGPMTVAASHPGVGGVDLVQAYPSPSSTIVGSVGFIDGVQCGYFWSVARGDSVTQTVPGPNRIKRAVLKLEVVSNGLASGAFVNWTVSINGTDIGQFTVQSGQTGPLTVNYQFPRKTGGSYTVKMRVTNEVAPGDGAMTLRYDGAGQHTVNLKRR